MRRERFVTRDARRNLRARWSLLLATVVAFLPLAATAGRASAATVSSANSNDLVRCAVSMVGTSTSNYNGGAICYFANTTTGTPAVTFGNYAGSTFTFDVSHLSANCSSVGCFSFLLQPTQATSGGAFGWDANKEVCQAPASGNAVKVYFGPQTVSGKGLPAGALAIECVGGGPYTFNTGKTFSTSYPTKQVAAPWYTANVRNVQICDPSKTRAQCDAQTPNNWQPIGGSVNGTSTTFRYGGIYASFSAMVNDSILWSELDNFPTYLPANETYFCGADWTIVPPKNTGSVLSAGDTVELTGNLTAHTDRIDIQWYTGGQWYEVVPTGHIGLTFDVTLTVPERTAAEAGAATVFLLGTRGFRCYDNTSNSFTYAAVGDNPAGAPSTAGRPCDLYRIYWPTPRQYATGDPATFAFSVSGIVGAAFASASTTTLQYSTVDDRVANPTALASRSWSNVPGYTWPVALGTSGSFQINAGFDSGNGQFAFRCTDAVGTMYTDAMLPDTADYLDPGSVGTTADCFINTGFTLYSPGTWVSGGVKMIKCVLIFLFVPSDSQVSSLTDAAHNVLAKAPFSWVVDGMSVVTNFSSQVQSALDGSSGSCFYPLASDSGFTSTYVNGPIVGHPSVCESDMSWASSIRVVLLAFFYIEIALWVVVSVSALQAS